MSRVTLGTLLGLAIGVVDVLLMLPLSFPDKRAALLGAFCARFALGFFQPPSGFQCRRSRPAWSWESSRACRTPSSRRRHAPILVTGLIFGAIAGWAVSRWACRRRLVTLLRAWPESNGHAQSYFRLDTHAEFGRDEKCPAEGDTRADAA